MEKESFIASGAVILAHDFSKPAKADTYIGKRCFIGVNAIIMCGVKVNDNVIVGSGSVVTKDIPANCIVAGNPARIIKRRYSDQKIRTINATIMNDNRIQLNGIKSPPLSLRFQFAGICGGT